MFSFRLKIALSLLSGMFITSVGMAEKPFSYPKAKHGKGELKYVNGIPVVTLQGSPKEMGAQLGALALKSAKHLTELSDKFIKEHGLQKIASIMFKTGNVFLPQFPAHHLKELEAVAKASGWPKEILIFGNTVNDLLKLIRCSVLIVSPEKSKTKGPLFGRNFDWQPFETLHEYTLVVIYKPKGKHAFASITYPGLLGCASGINDAGLALAANDVDDSNDGSIKVNPKGTPTGLALRRVLEECTSVKEAEKMLHSVRPASMLNVSICDKNGGAVFEITPKSFVVRRANAGICACTNHFRSKSLVTSKNCPRYKKLEVNQQAKRLGIKEVAKQMHLVNQRGWTIQSMIFEPKELKLHLAFGKGPATRLPLRTLDLRRLFKVNKK